MKRWMLWGVIAGAVFCAVERPSVATAVVATQLRSVVGTGGSVSSGTLRNVGTLGQAVIGRSQNVPMSVAHGFWSGGRLATTAVDDDPLQKPGLPREFSFGVAVPNPTRGSAQFELALPASGLVRVSLADVSGRMVAVVHDGRMEAGRHHITWDGRNAHGNSLSTGIYFARVELDGRRAGQRSIVVIR